MRATDNARLDDPGRDDRAYDDVDAYEDEHEAYDEGEDHQDEDYDEDEDFDEDEERKPLTTSGAARAGLRHVAKLTGKQPSGIVSLEPAEDGWVVGVEVVEDRRIPSSADILGIYQAEIATDGSLLAYRRSRRYARGRGDGGSEVA